MSVVNQIFQHNVIFINKLVNENCNDSVGNRHVYTKAFGIQENFAEVLWKPYSHK